MGRSVSPLLPRMRVEREFDPYNYSKKPGKSENPVAIKLCQKSRLNNDTH